MEKKELIEFMKSLLATELACSEEEIDENVGFFKLGISSIQALKLVNKMRKKLQIDINPVAMFEYNSISELADYLYECSQEQLIEN
jgi:acyl carrier protein